jgi:hypothetical protein
LPIGPEFLKTLNFGHGLTASTPQFRRPRALELRSPGRCSSGAGSAHPLATRHYYVRFHRLFSLALLLAATAPAVAQSPAMPVRAAAQQRVAAPDKGNPPATFRGAEAIGRWIHAYRQKPEPQHLPRLVHALANLGLLADQDNTGLYLGFIGGVLAANPAQAPTLVTKMFPLAPEHHAAIIKSIAYSGLSEWKDQLRAIAERTPSRVVLIDRFVTGRMPALADLQLDAGPVPLDVLWGNYFATGGVEPILRIVSVLKWAKNVDDVERLTVGSMVKWTLATNASSDVALIRVLKTALTFETKDVQMQLAEVLLAAETGETSKIRKDALAAIDQLKAKGPANTRNSQWWGQAGQMALAVGCVAASALGAGATVGIPCVIGGAASSAALKLATPQ